jgi:hypothetical protein
MNVISTPQVTKRTMFIYRKSRLSNVSFANTVIDEQFQQYDEEQDVLNYENVEENTLYKVTMPIDIPIPKSKLTRITNS